MQSIIKPKEPKDQGWFPGPRVDDAYTMGFEGWYWLYPERGITVISAVEVADDPKDLKKGPCYHISISKCGRRCSSNEARFVCKAFGMTDAEEDNHVPNGIARNFWMPVAEKFIGHECHCKDEEPAMVEDKGDYIWRGITK